MSITRFEMSKFVCPNCGNDSIEVFEMSKFVCPNCGNDSIEVGRDNSVKGVKLVYNLHCRTCGKRSAGYAENLREWKR